MVRAWSVLCVTILFSGPSLLPLSSARADTMVTLEDVTFADGGTASGYFLLNVYGYLSGAQITTTPGTSMGGNSLTGYTYTGGAVPGSPPFFDTLFQFNSTIDDFSLALEVADPLTPTYTGFDPLVAGSGSGATLAGSTETCQQNATACGGPGFLDGRLVTSGSLYASEPTSLSLLGVGGGLLAMVGRKRAHR